MFGVSKATARTKYSQRDNREHLTYKVSRVTIYWMFNPKGIDKTMKYIAHRASGKSKRKSALLSDYSANTAHIPVKIEQSNNYKALVSEILVRNGGVLQRVLASIERGEEHKLDEMDMQKKVEMLYKLAQTQKILSPEVKIKEEKDKDGNTKRTIWATTGADASKVDESVEK